MMPIAGEELATGNLKPVPVAVHPRAGFIHVGICALAGTPGCVPSTPVRFWKQFFTTLAAVA